MSLIDALPLKDISVMITDAHDTIDSESMVRFFWILNKEHYPLEQTVYIVLDGTAYHRSEMMKNASKVLNIELQYLIQYSLNLNPIERLWKVMNEHARYNIYFPSKATFTSVINNFFV